MSHWRATQVGVKQHSSCVDHWPEQLALQGQSVIPGCLGFAGSYGRPGCVDQERLRKIDVVDGSGEHVD
jgi:hypothetical protein